MGANTVSSRGETPATPEDAVRGMLAEAQAAAAQGWLIRGSEWHEPATFNTPRYRCTELLIYGPETSTLVVRVPSDSTIARTSITQYGLAQPQQVSMYDKRRPGMHGIEASADAESVLAWLNPAISTQGEEATSDIPGVTGFALAEIARDLIDKSVPMGVGGY